MECALPLQVELHGEGQSDSFALLDGEGLPLDLILRSPGREQRLKRAPLVAGRSSLYEASERASEWVLFVGEQELKRLPFQFLAQGVTRLEN
jgi:hypothetical protein